MLTEISYGNHPSPKAHYHFWVQVATFAPSGDVAYGTVAWTPDGQLAPKWCYSGFTSLDDQDRSE